MTAFDVDYAKMLTDFSALDSSKCSPAIPTLLFDLDQCTLYGEDTNDLITLAQFSEQPESSIRTLLTMIVNPAMVTAARQLLALHPNARICLYTRKSGFISGKGVPSHMLKAGEAYFPSETTLEEVLASDSPRIPPGLVKPYERLFMTRSAVQEVLGLANPPELIVTSVRKNVQRVCQTLLTPPADPRHAYLWDDNDEIRNDYHVIPVPKFNSFSTASADLIHSYLDAMYDGKGLDAEIQAKESRFLSTANPKHACYNQTDNTFFVYTDAHNDPVKWELPLIVDDKAFATFVVMAFLLLR
jgi:hypothetical protein